MHNENKTITNGCWLTIKGRRSHILILLSEHHFLWKTQATFTNEEQKMERDVMVSFVAILISQMNDNKQLKGNNKQSSVPQLIGLLLKLKLKYWFSICFSHQEQNPWCPYSYNCDEATCSVDPGPVAIEFSLNLLLAPQLHEGPAVFHPLPFLRKFPRKPNQTT